MNIDVLKKKDLGIIVQNEYIILQNIFSKWKYLGLICLLYLLAYGKLIFSDIPYMDDKARYLIGRPSFGHTLRLFDELYFRLFNMGNILYDISPLLQVLAIVVLSISSLLLLHILTGKITWYNAVLSSLLGIYPFFFENISYQIDSLFMALSILFCIFPFIYWGISNRRFVVASLLGLLFTLLTYQQAIVIYPILFILLSFRDYFLCATDWKELKNRLLYAIVCFSVVLIVYGALIYPQSSISKKTVSIFSSSNFVVDFVDNVFVYFSTIISSLGTWLTILTAGLVLSSVVILVLRSLKNKMLTLSVLLLLLFSLTVVSAGLTLFGKNPDFELRYFLCFNVFLVAVLLMAGMKKNFIYISLSFFLVGVLVNVANVYGNALDAQKQYDHFRMTIALSDLSKYVDSDQKYAVRLEGEINHPNFSNFTKCEYPIIGRIVEANSLLKYGGDAYVSQFFSLGEASKDCIGEKGQERKLLLKSYYHVIEKQGNCYYIRFNSLRLS